MNRLKQNYHWIIASIIFIEMILFGGFLNCISIFTVPMSESLGISRSSYSISQVCKSITAFLSTLFAGFTYQRWGYRKGGIGFLLLSAVAIVMVGLSQTLTLTCVAYALLGLSYGILGTTGAVRLVKDWFYKHQGTVLGVITMATGFGGSILSRLLSGITTQYSWRHAHFAIAVMLFFLALLYLFLRDKPSALGLKPYGYASRPQGGQADAASQTAWAGHTLQELLRMPQFYLMAACIFLSCLCVYISFSVLVPHFQDAGYSASEASGFHSMLLIALSLAKFFSGWLSDRIGAKRVTLLVMAIAAAGQWLLAAPSSTTVSCIGCLLLSIGLVVTTITAPLLTMPLFGYRAFGSISGIFMAMCSLGNMLATPLANLTYDWLGSYTPAFRLAAVMDIVVIGMFLLLFFLCDREKKKQLSTAA